MAKSYAIKPPRGTADAKHSRRFKNIVTPKKSQRQKFIDKARELGCDEDEEAFRDKLKRIAETPPPKPKEKQSK